MLAMALLVAACQTQQVYQVERTRSYGQDRQAVWDRLLRFLERNRIAVTTADLATGKITAERRDFAPEGWADCERRRVYDSTGSGSTRVGWALRVDRDLALEIALDGQAGATAVTVDARFAEEQINSWSYAHFTQPCRSTGVLERALLDALGAPPTSTEASP
jgi:hypothetical protein